MSDWTPLREFLRESAEAWIDHLIRSELDQQARAAIFKHRERILARMVDLAELEALRSIIAQREQAEQDEQGEPTIVRLNGSRAIKVAPR